MNLRLKLISVFLSMILVVIACLATFTLIRSANLQFQTVYQYAEMLADAKATEIQRRIEVFVGYAQVISGLLSQFETTPEHMRREIYEDVLESTIQKNERIVSVWTAWLPGSIDGRDAELGQFQLSFTRRNTGDVEREPAGHTGWQTYLANMTLRPVITSPEWADIRGHGNVPIVSLIYPIINEGGRTVGLFGLDYISVMQGIVDDLIQEIYEGRGVSAVYANDGTIVAHFDLSRVGDNIRTNTTEMALLGEEHNRVIQAIRNGGENGEPITVRRFSQALDTDVHMMYHPITITGMDTPWALMLAIPMVEITRPVRETTFIIVMFALVVLAVAAAITFFFAQRIVRPIRGVTLTLKDISEGEGDLTKQITIKTSDEIGDLARYFNLTLEKIKGLVMVIKNQAVMLSDIGNDLASNMTQTAAAVNQITSNIQSIKGRVINQSASVSQTNATMGQITTSIDKLNSHVERQAVSVSRSSSAIEEMLANIQSVTSTLVKNADNVIDLTDASEVGRTGLQGVAADIQEIARESEGLLEINAVMQNIASQTNLLSMNAAIEAAHAGEAGKGFAVVADEIRKLAENSSEQSKIISAVLKKIKEAIDKITRSTDNVLTKFEAIDSSVKIVADQEVNIRHAMEEQGEGSKMILEAISEVNDVTHQVKNGSGEMLEGSNEVIHEGKTLERVTQEITGGMNEMASGAEQINAAVHQVNELCGKNRESIDLLVREVSRFKVE
ncbi:MAG: methyl-accepting chemotaxis protein [Treponema sp.]|nr:methyl-accepting chemotaxis protein [Treponema sp.]